MNMSDEFIQVITAKNMTRKLAAGLYKQALQNPQTYNWADVNKAMRERWSDSGLEWIKKQAWKA